MSQNFIVLAMNFHGNCSEIPEIIIGSYCIRYYDAFSEFPLNFYELDIYIEMFRIDKILW